MIRIFRQILVIIAVIAVIVVNILANALPLNGLNTGEISDRFDVYFVPAGYVFSIWGLIYIGLIAFAVFQALPANRENPRLERASWLFILSCAANIAWIFCWHYEQFAWSVLAMLALLGLLIAVYLRLEIGLIKVPPAEKWCVQAPISVYLGWITVATIANITAFLYDIQWSGWGISPEVWTVIMLLAAAIIAALMALTRGDIAFLLVIIWAVTGIAIKQAATIAVSYPAWAVALFVAFLLVVAAVASRNRRTASPA
jgi:hypothetical protein